MSVRRETAGPGRRHNSRAEGLALKLVGELPPTRCPFGRTPRSLRRRTIFDKIDYCM